MSLCFYLPEISSWYDTSRFPGSTIDEEVEDNTTIAVLTAPRLFLVTQIHDDEDPNTPIVVVTAPSLRHGLPRIHDDDGVTVVCDHGHGTPPSLWFTTNSRRHRSYDNTMIFVFTATTVDGSTLPTLIGRFRPLSISPWNRLEEIVKPSTSLSVNDHDEDEDDNTAVVMKLLRSLCLF